MPSPASEKLDFTSRCRVQVLTVEIEGLQNEDRDAKRTTNNELEWKLMMRKRRPGDSRLLVWWPEFHKDGAPATELGMIIGKRNYVGMPGQKRTDSLS